MGEDISTGAKIGIILIILCALIAIVFALLTMMKNITNTGSAQMQNGLDQMLASQFQDYDQKIITGTQVMSAMSIFEGQPVGFVVNTTQSMKEGSKGYMYGALLKGHGAATTAPSGAQDGKVYQMSTGLTKTTGASYYTCNLDATDGVYMYNLNLKPCRTSGCATYVRTSAKYLAELIRDETGDAVGICFTQQT